MQRPPRSPAERLFTVALVGRAVLQGGLAFVVLASIAIAGHRLGLPPGELRTLLFFALVASVLALVLAHRSYSMAISHALIRHNVTFRYVLAAVVGASALILGLSPLQHALGFAPLRWPELALVAATGGVLLLAFELIKGVVPTPAK